MDLYNLVVSAKLTKGGGGGDIDVDELSVTENGTYSASSGHAYSPVTVSVPQSGITPTGTKSITENGIFDVTDFASASVSVPTGVFPSGTSSITANGIYDITNFASVDVNVSGGGGGGIAIDDIAMKTISGAISGSASFIEAYAFYSFKYITEASFPNAEYIGSSAFQGCNEIVKVTFPNLSSYIGQRAFQNCNHLKQVYILGSEVVTLHAYVFNSTPMSLSSYWGYFGSIYVPASLVDSYKVASNWSVYADRITSYVE